MIKHIAMTTLTATALLLSLHTSAYASAAEIDKQQKEQAVMIKQGMKTCQLTPAEAKTLKAEQAVIAGLEKKFRAKGFSPWELKTLTSKLHDARVHINKLTQNSTKCSTSVKPRDLQPGVIHRTDPSRTPRTTDGRGTIGVVIGR